MYSFDTVVFCFFTDTATTEIYTYGHTLSLHDALPISIGQSFTFHQNRTADDFAGMAYEVGTSTVKWSIRLENIAEFLRGPQRVTMRYGLDSMRSEEHTSELQSLMRISYAVFCLKKKTTTNTNKPQHIHNKEPNK